MYFVFVDEAGQPGHNEKAGTSNHFTLAGVMVDGDLLLKLEKDLSIVKGLHDLDDDVEFKWNGKYSKVGWDYEVYHSYRQSMFNLISQYSFTVIASVIDKNKAYQKEYINDHIDVYKQALFLLMERANNHIRTNGKHPVVFVLDSRKNDKDQMLDLKLAYAYKNALRMGTYYTNFPYFSKNPIFVSSEDSAGVQLADYAAGAIHQLAETGKKDWYNVLRPNIRKSPDGRVVGFGVKLFP